MTTDSGGWIFVDSDGHASTLIGDRLVYLGNVTGLFNQEVNLSVRQFHSFMRA